MVTFGPIELGLLIILALSAVAVVIVDGKEIKGLKKSVLEGILRRVFMAADLNDQLLQAGRTVGETVKMRYGSMVVTDREVTDKLYKMVMDGKMTIDNLKELMNHEEQN